MRKLYVTYQLSAILFTLFNFSYQLTAQTPEPYTYQYYHTLHGLPSPEIICLAKDSQGFLWVGTAAGLSMYDGYNFHNYAYTKQQELIGYVNVIKADGDRLWIGSGAGLFCYSNNAIVKISANSILPQGVNDILVDTDRTVWLATENGPVTLHKNQIDCTGRQKITLATHIIPQWTFTNEVIDKRRTTLVSKASDGTIYIAQWYNLFRLINDKLEQIFTTTNSSNKILTLFPISQSKIYFDAASTEINLVENGLTTIIPYKKFYQPADTAQMPGHWYVGTRGAFYFHPQTGLASIHIAFSDKYLVWATAVLQDKGFLWVASHDGLIKLKPAVFTPYTVDKTERFIDYYSVQTLQNGQLLLGANIGKIFEKHADSFRVYKDKVVPRAEIKDIHEDKRHWLWIASGYQGLVVIRNNKVDRFTVDNGLHDNSLSTFLPTSNGKLYVLGDAGISEIIVNNNETISFKTFSYPPNTSQYAKFYSGIEAPDGTLWIGGEEGLAHLRNDSLSKFLFNGQQLVVNCIIKDKEGNIWIAAAGQGIFQCVFNVRNEPVIVKQFTENDGLNTLYYLTILADADNNIWAGSSKGVSVIGRSGGYKNSILNFDESDGFIKAGYSGIRLHQAPDSTIWAAATFGLTSFKPKRLLPPDVAPKVYITSIRQIKKNESIAGEHLRQYESVPAFSYSNNSFNFNFLALDYFNQENIRYYYQLQGLDTAWVNSGSLRSISFENLSP